MKTNLPKTLIAFAFVLTTLSGLSQTFTASGTFVVPCGVNSIDVRCWGAGGGGSGDGADDGRGGGGGGGGAFSSATIVVTPGQSINYTVGTGGAGGSAGLLGIGASSGGDGSATTFSTVNAAGGLGSPIQASGSNGVGGAGVGAGTNGAANAGSAGGAGGNAATNGGVGGTGAAGGANDANGTGAIAAGRIPGGGGGGAGDASSFLGLVTGHTGGVGARGEIRIVCNVNIQYNGLAAGTVPANNSGFAGPDITLLACQSSATMAATALSSNPAGFEGTGAWTRIDGGGAATSPTSNTSGITGLTLPLAGQTWRWTVTRPGCATVTDDIDINTSVVASVNAGVDQPLAACVDFGTLAATAIPNGGTGTWSCTSGCGGVSIASPNSATSTFSGIPIAGTTVLTWTGCSRTDNVSITTVAAAINAGADIVLAACTVTGTLAATALPNGGIGTWSCITNCGGVGITAPTSPTSTFTGLTVPNVTTLRWSGCGATDDVFISTVTGPGCPTCTDGIQNQGETGLDCGGVFCAPCNALCSTFSAATSDIVGGIVDARVSDQTITTCVNVSYSNRGTNWLHGVFMNPSSTGLVSTAATGALPEPNYNSLGTVYKWSNQTANFTGSTSGNSLSQNGWFVETGAVNSNPGDNLGWPDAANTVFGPFCFQTVVSCTGLNGDVAAFLNFQTTGDSYSGSWTTVDCGKETSFGATAITYTLKCPVLLPLELLSFDGNYTNRSVKLNWSTASETNNDYFTLLRSADGLDFKEIAKVKGSGTSTVNHTYSFTDEEPISPIGYYKIKQTDFNGENSESNVIGIISPAYFDNLNVVPNPVNDIASVMFNSSVAENTQVKVFDVSGKLFIQDSFESDKGMNNFSFSTKDFTDGIYFIEITNGLDLKNIKFIKQQF